MKTITEFLQEQSVHPKFSPCPACNGLGHTVTDLKEGYILFAADMDLDKTVKLFEQKGYRLNPNPVASIKGPETVEAAWYELIWIKNEDIQK